MCSTTGISRCRQMVADIQIKATAKVVERRLKELAKRSGNLRPYFDDVAPGLVASSQARFKRGQTPTGRPWKKSASAKRENRRTLVDTGHLRDSIVYKVGAGGTLAIGSGVFYGDLHQKGYRVRIKPKSRTRTSASKILERKIGANLPNFRLPPVGSPFARFRQLQNRMRPKINFNVPGRRRARRIQTRRIPARRFLGMSKANRRTMSKRLTVYLKGALRAGPS